MRKIKLEYDRIYPDKKKDSMFNMPKIGNFSRGG